MSDEVVGGTRIQRRPVEQPAMQQQQPMMQQPQPMMQQPQPMMQQQQPMMQQPQPTMQQPQPVAQPPSPVAPDTKSTFSKSNFGNITFDITDFKYSLLVMLIFIILNSKIIWKQIARLPLMDGLDQSMIALLINSIIAGISFYIISNYIIKK